MSFYLDIFYINKFIIEFVNPNLKITPLDTKRLLYTIVFVYDLIIKFILLKTFLY